MQESHVDRQAPSTRTKQQSLKSAENWLKSQVSEHFPPNQGKYRKQFTLRAFCLFLTRPDTISPVGLFPTGVKLKRTRQIGRLSEYGMTESGAESGRRPHSLSLSLKYIATILSSVAAAILPHSLPMRRVLLPDSDRESGQSDGNRAATIVRNRTACLIVKRNVSADWAARSGLVQRGCHVLPMLPHRHDARGAIRIRLYQNPVAGGRGDPHFDQRIGAAHTTALPLCPVAGLQRALHPLAVIADHIPQSGPARAGQTGEQTRYNGQDVTHDPSIADLAPM